MNEVKLRESNFELLRIMLMIGIIFFHYSDVGCSDLDYSNGLVINTAFERMFEIGGGIGNCSFMILTGYFLSKSNFRFEKLLKLWGQVFFYSVGLYLLSIWMGLHSFDKNSFKQVLFPITSNQYWYFTAYVIIFFLSPAMNVAVERLEKRQIIVMMLAMTWFFSLITLKGYYSSISDNRIGTMALLYLIGAYIRKYYSPKSRRAMRIEATAAVVLFDFLTFFCVFFDKYTWLANIVPRRRDLVWGIEKTPVIVLSALIFLVFKNIDVKLNRLINWLAGSTFGVYLLHVNVYIGRFIWFNLCKTTDYYMRCDMILHNIICVLLIFSVATITDKLRIYLLERPIMALLSRKRIL